MKHLLQTIALCVEITFEKQAPMWTFGVGGSPLETGLLVPDVEEVEGVDDDAGGGGVGDVRWRRGGAFGEVAEERGKK